MAWPLSQDYNEAVQNPQTSFSDPELRQGQVVVNALGIPQPCSGNFADVYAVECPATQTKWAVKCFTREVRGLRERYQEISRALQQARLPFTVEFSYLERGIRIRSDWFPVLKMQWVEGFTLNEFVRQNVERPAMLGGLLQNISQTNQNQLPWLGDVPVLGALFRSAAYQKNETDLVIVVTPRLVTPLRPQDPVHTPLDSTLPGNDVDFFLMGNAEVSPALARLAVGALNRPYVGHVLDLPKKGGFYVSVKD